jgi:hypothetical protein
MARDELCGRHLLACIEHLLKYCDVYGNRTYTPCIHRSSAVLTIATSFWNPLNKVAFSGTYLVSGARFLTFVTPP